MLIRVAGRTVTCLLLVLLWASAAPGQTEGLRFAVTFSEELTKEPQTGTLYLLLTEELVGQARHHLDRWPMRGYVFKKAVKDWKLDEPVFIDAGTPGYPTALPFVKPGPYNVQAILDVHRTDHEFVFADGNGRSRALRPEIDPTKARDIDVVIDTRIVRGRLTDIPRVRYRKLESRLAGRHLGDRFFVEVAVVLPPSYSSDTKRRYPVQYWFPELGTTPRGAVQYFQQRGIYHRPYLHREDVDEFVYVLIGTHGRRGHHGWLDSDVNGPMMQSFFEEMLPGIEEEFKVSIEPEGRYLVGAGAGGWSALSLLFHRPNAFAGAWALAPDPVDFTDFFGIDLYADPPENAFIDARGAARPLARDEGRVAVTWQSQAEFEAVMGTGNLLQSYEAMFGRPGKGGEARPLFDRKTGQIDPATAKDWSRFDLTRIVEQKWSTIAESLQGKVHIYVGEDDNYFLARPVLRLRDLLENRGSDAEIEVIPDLDHTGIVGTEIQHRVQREITAKERARKP